MKKEKKSLTKEQQQIAILGLVLAIIVGALVYMYYDKILPQPYNPGIPVQLNDHINFKSSNPTALFERSDFRSLKAFGDVPVKVLPGDGNDNPFEFGLQ